MGITNQDQRVTVLLHYLSEAGLTIVENVDREILASPY